MLYNLHLLRVIAALGVVYFHTTSEAGLGLDWDVGSRGVDVFFVISGFIIAYIGSKKPDQFFIRRLIRVVPFYWAATICVFAAAALAPSAFRSTTANVPHLAYSLAFLPHSTPTTGLMPTLLLGWSLNYEMFFYVVFALALLVSQKWSPLVCVGAILCVVLAMRAAGTSNEVAGFYGRPIVLEFCYGVGVFYLLEWITARRDAVARLAMLKWVLLALFVASLIAIPVLEEKYREEIPRHLIAGIPAFFVVASALILERVYGLFTKNPLVFLLGEASYIIYLVHPYIIFTVLRVGVPHASAWPVPAIAALIVALLALTSAIAVAIHVWFEKPVMAYLRGKLT
jgi:exopolysaccharide production protein ExoZ